LLSIFILFAAAVLVMFSKGLGLALAIFGVASITHPVSFEWLPGITFGWQVVPEWAPLMGVFVLITAIALFSARKFTRKQLATFIIFVSGLLGFVGASHPLQFFFFMEMMIFPAFYLIFEQDPAIAFKYFAYMQVAALLVLAGIFSSGTVSAVMFTLAFAIKMGLFPLGSWLPDAHSQAPHSLSTLLSSCTVVCGAYGLYRFSYHSFLLLVLAFMSIVYGAWRATRDEDLKRVLAFSTVSQMGYAVLALIYAPRILPTFLLMHSLAKATLFLSAGIIIDRTGIRRMEGLGVTSFSLMPACLVATLSLAGVPPLLGFWTDLAILKAVTPLPLMLVALATMFFTLLYVERLMAIFFRREGRQKVEGWLPLLTAVLLVLGGILYE